MGREALGSDLAMPLGDGHLLGIGRDAIPERLDVVELLRGGKLIEARRRHGRVSHARILARSAKEITRVVLLQAGPLRGPSRRPRRRSARGRSTRREVILAGAARPFPLRGRSSDALRWSSTFSGRKNNKLVSQNDERRKAHNRTKRRPLVVGQTRGDATDSQFRGHIGPPIVGCSLDCSPTFLRSNAMRLCRPDARSAAGSAAAAGSAEQLFWCRIWRLEKSRRWLNCDAECRSRRALFVQRTWKALMRRRTDLFGLSEFSDTHHMRERDLLTHQSERRSVLNGRWR